jgi:hypothetical protein
VKVLPLVLSDGTKNYIYGPGGLPVEQINTEDHVTYLHHDQVGSTQLITGSTGSKASTLDIMIWRKDDRTDDD